MARSLTPGEMRVLHAYVVHENHEAAATALGISTQTLKNHLGSIYKKLEVKKAHAAVYALAVNRGCDVFDGKSVAQARPGTPNQAEDLANAPQNVS